MAIEPGDLDDGVFTIGKAAVFYKAPAWDFGSNITTGMTFLGYTEGEIGAVFNETFNNLTLNEYTGEAIHEANVSGEGPEVTIPIFTADPALRAILSPTGSASGGGKRQRPVATRTLWLVPEEMFLDVSDPTLQETLPLTWSGSAWQLGGQALTDDQEDLMAQSIILWKGYFSKPPLRYRWEEAGKSVDEVTFRAMYQRLAPVGHRLYSIGDFSTIVDPATGDEES